MTITAASFKEMYSDFAATPDALVTKWITKAYETLDPDVFGIHLDNAAGAWTADKLARHPGGNTAKLVAKDGSTVYGDEFETYALACGAGQFRVT